MSAIAMYLKQEAIEFLPKEKVNASDIHRHLKAVNCEETVD